MAEKQVFIGIGKAVSKYPEWWGEKTVEWYDKLRFPKFTKEEEKVKDRVHNILKKNYKAIGWAETGIQAAIVSVVVAKGISRIRNKNKPRFIPKPGMPAVPVEEVFTPPPEMDMVRNAQEMPKRIIDGSQPINGDVMRLFILDTPNFSDIHEALTLRFQNEFIKADVRMWPEAAKDVLYLLSVPREKTLKGVRTAYNAYMRTALDSLAQKIERNTLLPDVYKQSLARKLIDQLQRVDHDKPYRREPQWIIEQWKKINFLGVEGLVQAWAALQPHARDLFFEQP